MTDIQSHRNLVSLPKFLLLVVTISVTACVSNYSSVPISPGEAASVLQPGDRVEIRQKDDDEVVHLKVRKINDTEVHGSNERSMFGRIKETIPLDDIDSINLYRKEDGYDSEATIEVYSWIWAIVFWPLVL